MVFVSKPSPKKGNEPQVVKAVRAAVACFLSEAAILEVWDLLKDPHLGRMLLPRPGGGWMWLDPDTDWPL